MNNPFLQVQQPITIGSYLLPIILFIASQTVIFIVTTINNHVKTMTKIKELEVRVGMMEKQDAAIMDKLDDLTEIIQQLRIDLQNKSDRK